MEGGGGSRAQFEREPEPRVHVSAPLQITPCLVAPSRSYPPITIMISRVEEKPPRRYVAQLLL